MVRQLAEKGVTVILTARDVERGYNAIKELRNSPGDVRVHFYRLDVSDPASIKSFASQFEKDFGVLDILVSFLGLLF